MSRVALSPIQESFLSTGTIPPATASAFERYPDVNPALVGAGSFSDAVSEVDCERLATVFRRMHALSCKPIHTGFRVYSALHYRTRSGEPAVVFGTNTESSCFAQGVCAERSALMGLRTADDVDEVTAVYVVSDAPVPLTPGMLCREFLTEFISPYTPITVASLFDPTSSTAATDTLAAAAAAAAVPVGHTLHTSGGLTFIARVTRLHWLYPHPPLLQSLWGPPGSERAVRAAKECKCLAGKWGFGTDSPCAAAGAAAAAAAAAEALPSDSVGVYSLTTPAALLALHRSLGSLPAAAAAARAAAAAQDPEAGIAAVSLAAAAILPSGEIVTAAQAKVLEMGHSLDPLAALFARLRGLPAAPVPVAVVVSDAHGALHPPSAAARALLVEHGWKHVKTAFFSTRSPCFPSASRVADAREGLYAAVTAPCPADGAAEARAVATEAMPTEAVPVTEAEGAVDVWVPRLPVAEARFVVCELGATYPDRADFLACN